MNASTVIATILRHDKKITSYKIALIRSISDVALGHSHIGGTASLVAIPLKMLASYWTAYYWPFVDASRPIMQGQQTRGKHDISFRPALSALRREWEQIVETSRPADGFFLMGELASERRRKTYPDSLLEAFRATIKDIVTAIQQPIRYAGPGEHTVFPQPERWRLISSRDPNATCIPGTQPNNLCLVLSPELWVGFRDLFLWIEALCIHEWSLFTESLAAIDRGIVYGLLTDRPDNRRPLTWERNQIDILMMEGQSFQCPWTGNVLQPGNFDVDHLIPISVYPINEMWNLVPADRDFNQHTKRDRLPSGERLAAARPRLINAYQLYLVSPELSIVLKQDAEIRFDGSVSQNDLPATLTQCISSYIATVTNARNLAVF
jgi:hypothetical protein